MKKYTFSPGPTMCSTHLDINFSHRGAQFINLYKKTIDLLRSKYGIGNDYTILLIQGSATAAIEAVISSLFDKSNVIDIFPSGVFSDRMAKIAKYYTNIGEKDSDAIAIVHFETSCSKIMPAEQIVNHCKKSGIISIIDAVSSFGYINVPEADVIITSSGKIIGSVPVMGIIFIKNHLLNKLKGVGDYLNLNKYVEYAENNQTPHTSLIPQIYSLWEVLKQNNVEERKKQIRKNIEAVNRILKVEVGGKLRQIGSNNVHVLTYELNGIPLNYLYNELLKLGFELYINKSYMKNCFQISCFSVMDEKIYVDLCNKINEVVGNG